MKQLTKVFRWGSVIGSAALLTTIFIGCPRIPLTEECRHFYKDLSSNQREKVFQTFDLEKQLRIYRCGLDLIPMDQAHSIQIAERGKSIIPVLLKKLETENDPITQYGIILVFEMMSASDDLNGDREAIEKIENTVSQMKRGWWKDRSEKSLAAIQNDNSR